MKTVNALLILVLILAAPAHAAVVRLKDGGRVEGTVMSTTAREVLVQTSGGPRRIDAALVQSIEYESGAAPATTVVPSRSEPVGAGESVYATAPHDEKNLLSFALGLAAPLSDVNFAPIGGGSANNGDLGPLIGIRYLRSLSRRFAAGVDFEYLHRSGTDSPSLLPLANASVFGDNLVFMGIARWHMTDGGRVRPYLLGGAGVSRSWTKIDAAPITGFTWTDTNTDEVRRLVDDAAWAFASTARVGVDFDWDFAEPAIFSLEAGWTGLESKRFGATRSGRDLGIEAVSGRLNFFVLAARWSVRW
jgi:opacity protein-like surface antigen